MTLDIGRAIEDGLSDAASRTGAMLVVALAVLGVSMTLATGSLMRTLFFEAIDLQTLLADAPPGTIEEFTTELETQFPVDVLDLPVGALLAAVVALWLAQIVVRIGAIRWFVEERTGGLSAALFTRRLLWTVGNLLVGAVLYFVLVAIGLVLLVVPGIFLAVALFFYNYEIVVEGENAIEALANSYHLTKGNRLVLFLLGLLFAVVGGVLAQVGNPVIVPAPVLASVLGSVVGAVVGVAGIGVAAAAYRQLREPSDDAEEVGALGPDDL